MQKTLLLLALLLVSGCANNPVVRVPVSQPCLSKDAPIPAEPRKVGPELTGDSGRDIGIISGSALELRAWGRALLGIVEACRK